MNFTFDKEWLQRQAESDQNLDVAAGSFAFDQLSPATIDGNMLARDRHLGEQAVKFAARSESVEKLSRQEHQALEEFVKYLNDSK